MPHYPRRRGVKIDVGVYETGGPEATTYRDMIATYAAVRGLRPRRIIEVPVLTPRLSAWWVDLVTPVDRRVSHALIESLTTDVVVEDLAPVAMAFDVTPLAAMDAASEGRAARVSATLTTRRPRRPRLVPRPGRRALQMTARLCSVRGSSGKTNPENARTLRPCRFPTKLASRAA